MRWALPWIVACSACSPNAPLVLAPMRDADAGSRLLALPREGAAPEVLRGVCSATLRVRTVTPSPPSCWLDERVGNKTAELRYPCGGGLGQADFGVPFRGTVDEAGTVEIEATTSYRWSGDGCNWHSAQRIRGVLGDGELTYSYEEHADGMACSPATCVASTPVAVVRSK